MTTHKQPVNKPAGLAKQTDNAELRRMKVHLENTQQKLHNVKSIEDTVNNQLLVCTVALSVYVTSRRTTGDIITVDPIQ